MAADSAYSTQSRLKKKTQLTLEIETSSGSPFKNTGPCEYWKQNSTAFPALFYYAQFPMAIPASPVPSESSLSEADHFL
jgi:hypothetical protein